MNHQLVSSTHSLKRYAGNLSKKTTAAKVTTTTTKNNLKHKEPQQKTNLPAETSIEPSNSTW